MIYIMLLEFKLL